MREYDRCVRRVVIRSGGRDEEEDLRQEVWARLLAEDAAALRRFRGSGPRALPAFLARVARSVAIDHLRARAARPATSDCEGLEALADQSPTPERAVSSEEATRRRAGAVGLALRGAERPGRDGDILRLHFEEGLSAQEISTMGVGLAARGVEAVLRRAKARIEQLLGDDKP